MEGDALAISARLPADVARRVGQFRSDAPLGEAPALSSRDLMMNFEGLGDNCEFGLVQRQYGAEPMGLLRWSSGIKPEQLIGALACKFDGVGHPDNTFVRLHPVAKEYFAGDNRFFQMHTFIKQNEHEESVLYSKICRRMAYLKAKLVTDLNEGSKIFVYKPDGIDLTDAEGAEIAAQMSRNFPAAKVMLMRIAPSISDVGKITSLHDNAIWGFLSGFAVNLDRRFIRFDEWRMVCMAAATHFRR
jgi:hypothetical protein